MRENLIFPCIEAFQARLEIPCVYMIFHEYFLKSCVGDARWKAICIEGDDLSAPLSPVQGEAFAMITLNNNYFAWLWDLKVGGSGHLLVTDYDTDAEHRKKKAHVGEATIIGAELNLEEQDEAEEEPDDPIQDDDEEEGGSSLPVTSSSLNFQNVLVPEVGGGVLYRELKKKNRSCTEEGKKQCTEEPKVQGDEKTSRTRNHGCGHNN